MNYNEYKYKLKKAEILKKKANKARAEKELFFGAGIEQHDLNTKCNKLKKFLLKGNICKISTNIPRALS